jgi:hypothetical protein
MTFTNMLREQHPRTFGGKRMNGWVVNNDDSKHADGKRLQRMQIRLPHLHDDIEDADLPWFTTGGQSPYSGGADIGNHGPIPPNGTKTWIRFEDDSQYHGQYLAGVATTDNQIPEFVDPQGKDKDDQADPGNDGDNSSTGPDDKVKDEDNPTIYGKEDYRKDYPQAHGSVDESGNFTGHSMKTDFHETYHVSGTSKAIDGKGNMQVNINGNADRSTSSEHRARGEMGGGNPNAKAKLPEGFSSAVFGHGTIYISKDCTISVGGNASIITKGDALVSAQGKCTVASKGDVKVSSKGKLDLVSDSHIQLSAPSITSSVEIVVGGSGSSETPKDVKAAGAIKVRKRPAPMIPANDLKY